VTNLMEHLIAGGPVMIPIGLASILGMAVFAERLWSNRRGAVAPRKLIDQILSLARQGRFEEALAASRARDVAATRILGVALDTRGKGRKIVKERLEEAGHREAGELERFLPVLATIGTLGPLLGLLGTVGGMIVTFEAVRASGQPSIQDLAGGIAQALITTFAGLILAIPAVIAHRILLSQVDTLLLELEDASATMLEIVAGGEGP
jgi:biopolymer transport protein ExbB